MIDLHEAIAFGRTAEIFTYGEEHVLKLFRSGIPDDIVDTEFVISQYVYNAGVSIPRPIKMIEIQERKGIVYQRISGDTLLERIRKRPWSMINESKRLAKLHSEIHKISVLELPSQYDVLYEKIVQAPLLTIDEKEHILRHLSMLDRDTKLCHGDLHPDNIILTDREWVIDWMTGTKGNPAADVARTVLLLKFGTMPFGTPTWISYLFSRIREFMLQVYLRHYLTNSSVTVKAIDDWFLPIAAARLVECVPNNEKHAIVKSIRKKLYE